MIGVLSTTSNRVYRDNVESCQILITEPYCAELLTTSPHYRRLLSRIRYIIFDEVHNIVSPSGKVWENLLVMTNAPFVALSATIGNPDQFSDWLSLIEKARGYEYRQSVTAVQHRERYNDLKPYVWGGAASPEVYSSVLEPTGLLRKVVTVKNELGLDVSVKFDAKAAIRDALGLSLADVGQVTEEQLAMSGLKEINPVGLLNLDALDMAQVRTNVADEVKEKAIEMLPEDCPTLYFKLVEALADGRHPALSAAVASLNPDSYFPDGVRIEMKRAHEYGRKLMEVLFQLVEVDRPAAQAVRSWAGGLCCACFGCRGVCVCPCVVADCVGPG